VRPVSKKNRAVHLISVLGRVENMNSLTPADVDAKESGLRCPHCTAWLLEIERDPRWQRYFLCRECFAAWHAVHVKVRRRWEWSLERGRTPREASA